MEITVLSHCRVFNKTLITLVSLDFHKILYYKTFNKLNHFIAKEHIPSRQLIKRLHEFPLAPESKDVFITALPSWQREDRDVCL